MLQNFTTYQLAVQFYRLCWQITLPHYLKDQLLRSLSSIALNLAEGSAKPTKKDQLRYYHIAMGSLRESQAALDLCSKRYDELIKLADRIGACLYKLCKG